ncbi:unnamed protein product (macronuclear) [Paramecium tetraurelia]|uniref:YopX protein domain-containing protein n=1 Tax=Paramecium tetraurelia TaxID=5888 RepID=A0CJ87_PARTE|nr:uncharacterized protein GSPATT00038636001 [Paramecium tetraurelia]CAK70854.1 unnamed protein product [Paramecium tetraurelia]|eukprot:XP_001438251.1 hypothetical protein (macronuclear) [Paramecium tetraurelia strain d4-2]
MEKDKKWILRNVFRRLLQQWQKGLGTVGICFLEKDKNKNILVADHIVLDKMRQKLEIGLNLAIIQFNIKVNIKNGKKIGWWDQKYMDQPHITGGGAYDGDGNKIDEWIDICEWSMDKLLIIEKGGYKKGKKVGLWEYFYDTVLIGGGQYDESGDEIKIGNWVEFCEQSMYNLAVTWKGEYKNGKKVGVWVEIIGPVTKCCQQVSSINYDD